MNIFKTSKVHTFLVGIMTMIILLCCSSQVQAAKSGDYTYTVTGGKAQITGYTGAGGVVTVPNTLGGVPVTSIGNAVFVGCTSLSSISIPQGVLSIGYITFEDCTSLASVSLPQGLLSIGDGAFQGCTSLSSINLPQELTSINNYAFSDCIRLRKIIIPPGVTDIGASVFSGCSGLYFLSLPQGLTSIGDFAFSGCIRLRSITIPQEVTSISHLTFQGTSLDSIRFNSRTIKIRLDYNYPSIPTETTIIGYKDSTARVYAALYGNRFEVITEDTMLGAYPVQQNISDVYSSENSTKLAGNDRYDTAVAIAKAGWSQADTAIIAFGENFHDALVAAPLAKKYDAPILLTESNVLTGSTKQALTDLWVKNVIIVGGTGVISSSVENTLQAIGISTTRIAGNDRYETSVKIAQQLEGVKEIAIVNGDSYADALSISSVAGIKNMPILLVDSGNELPQSMSAYIVSQDITNSYVIGGSAVVKDAILNQLPNATRVSGVDRYATNVAVLDQFTDIFDFKTVCMVTGDGFSDGLTGTAYAIKNNLPIVLLPNDSSQVTENFMSRKASLINKTVIFGGN